MKKTNSEVIPYSAGIKEIVKIGGKNALKNLNPLQVLTEYFNYKKTVDEEETKREDIRAWRDVAIAQIEANKDFMEKYFKEKFSERALGLKKFFDLLDRSIESKNDKQLDTALNGILGILKDSPLKDFETFRQSRQRGEILEL